MHVCVCVRVCACVCVCVCICMCMCMRRGEGAARGVTFTAVLELNAKLKEAEVKRISAEEKLKLLDAQLQRAQHQVT